ncbi:MAG: hypothetical protein HY043_18715 [Verrucomicrobia bacterium]|nr:hypothetical protein [Verrucomicrobiota bacterium]
MFDLAAERDFAHEFRETFQNKGYSLVVAPTVVAELYFLSEHGDAQEKRLSSTSLARSSSWDIKPFALSMVQLEIAKRFARRLLDQALLPETELNDARILGETSMAAIPLVVTSDKHLLDIDEDSLRQEFDDADLMRVSTVSPRRLLRAIH